MKSAIFFDIDNTLYDARQYYIGAFKNISSFFEDIFHIDKEISYNTLMRIYLEKGSSYPYIFDDALKILNIDYPISKVVDLFNNTKCNIYPYYDVKITIERLKIEGYTLGIISDGRPERQKRKLETLNILHFFDIIIFTYETESPKPSEIPFRKASLKACNNNIYYIGDNPYIDFKGAKKLNFTTIRLLRGDYSSEPGNSDIDYEIHEFKDLFLILGE